MKGLPLIFDHVLTFRSKKKSWWFHMSSNEAGAVINKHFVEWLRVTYIWTPENFGMYLRKQGIRYQIKSATYTNL